MLSLVTGASSGIGLKYATVLARDYKSDLIIVSNQEQELNDVAAQLHSQYNINTYVIYKDLTEENAAEELHNYCIDNALTIDVLINNAGVFFFNELTNTSTKRIDTMLKLHVLTLTRLTHLFAEDMKQRQHGYILNMSSMSAWMLMPGIQTYNATKAYILNFSKSMWYELHPYNVGITVATPGAVDTGLYGLSPYWRNIAVKVGVSIPPEQLAQKALKAMFKQRKQCMPGFINHIATPLLKHLPDWLIFLVLKQTKQFQK